VAHERVRTLERRAAELSAAAGTRDRELDLLRFELDEIESIDPTEEEEHELPRERDRLRHLETLRGAAADGAEAISSEGEAAGVAELLGSAAAALEGAAEIDPDLRRNWERIEALRYEAEDISSELRAYLTGIEERAAGSAGELERVEERIAQLTRLQRKHGGSVADALRHAQDCRARLEAIEHADEALAAAEGELAEALAERDQLAARLGATRRKQAPVLAAAVRDRLADLAMPDAEFEVRVERRADGCGPRGADTVEFEIAPNPGLPIGPLREIASGGELSRVMVALLGVAHSGGRDEDPALAPALVFDEVDAGIGGHTARAVGEHLRALAAGRQIVCITHLPQIASLADRHFRIEKRASDNKALTSVSELAGEGVVSELVRMLGADEGDSAAGRHARRLLKAA
jgi:DNA repair protein RecN (Recombination protein N)